MIKVIASGLFSTIQDLGRFGHRNHGVPVSGAMDQESSALANRLLGNDAHAPLIEFTASGPVLEFSTDANIAITGAFFSPKINDVVVKMNRVVRVEKGERLSFTSPETGVRGYVSIAGGFKAENVLGSCSFYPGITTMNKLQKGDSLEFDPEAQGGTTKSSAVTIPSPQFNEGPLVVYKGPEFGLLNTDIQNLLQKKPFKISSQSNRMAYVLESAENISAKGIITTPVQPGTVQLTPSGSLHILMRDAQTTGGYARIFQLSEKAINALAQKRAGEQVCFKIIDPPFDTPS